MQACERHSNAPLAAGLLNQITPAVSMTGTKDRKYAQQVVSLALGLSLSLAVCVQPGG